MRRSLASRALWRAAGGQPGAASGRAAGRRPRRCRSRHYGRARCCLGARGASCQDWKGCCRSKQAGQGSQAAGQAAGGPKRACLPEAARGAHWPRRPATARLAGRRAHASEHATSRAAAGSRPATGGRPTHDGCSQHLHRPRPDRVWRRCRCASRLLVCACCCCLGGGVKPRTRRQGAHAPASSRLRPDVPLQEGLAPSTS